MRKEFIAVSLSSLLIAGGIFYATSKVKAQDDRDLYSEPVSEYCVIDGIPEIVEEKEPQYIITFATEEKHVVGMPPIIGKTETVQQETSITSYTEAELEMLAIVIFQEAGGDACSDETRRMVGEVVLNRVADPRFPDTIEKVLTQKSQYGRMYWTGIVWASRASHPGEQHAVERAYACAKAVFEEERLLPTDVVFQAAFPQGRETVVHVPGFYFCR